ncbi:MAG: hypothetical protein GF329_06600 [Candidatus Lokiarchaeota archaeon]|nr:hypothetical protein [Candidatus Lokiarchaeota archaeon]
MIKEKDGNFKKRGSYIVQDDYAPSINDYYNDPSEVNYNDTFEIFANIIDPTGPALSSGVNTVLLNYSVDGVWQQEVEMNHLNGTNWNGWWSTIISDNYNYSTVIQYYFIVNDSASNEFDNLYDISQITITDSYFPNIGNILLNDSDVMYYESLNITVRITEPLPPISPANSSGISTVSLLFNNTYGWHSLPMTLISGSRYNGTYSAILSNQPYGYIYYRINATDIAGNSNITQISAINRYFSDDDIAPQVETPTQTPVYTQVNYNDTVTVKINVSEPQNASQVHEVKIQYYNGTSWVNISALRTTGDEWEANIPADFNYSFEVAFRIHAIDNEGNYIIEDNSSIYYNYTIIDKYVPENNLPKIEPAGPLADIDVNLTIKVWEPLKASGVDKVIVCIWNKTGESSASPLVNYTMDYLNNDWYNITIPGVVVNTTVWYFFYINDTAGNNLRLDNNGENWSYFVPDSIAPSINNVTFTPLEPEYNQPISIIVNCNDTQSGIGYVEIFYQINNNGTWFIKEASKGLGNNWSGTIGPFNYGNDITFYVNVTDGAGLASTDNNNSDYYNFTIFDSYSPVIGSSILSPLIINYNDQINITVQIEDPTGLSVSSGIGAVLLNFSIDGSWQAPIEMSLLSGNNWSGWWNVIISPQNYGSYIEYYFICNDTAGNFNNNSAVSSNFTIGDDVNPFIIDSDLNDPSINYNETVNVTVEVGEDKIPALASGIDTVLLNYSSDGIDWNVINMSYITGDIQAGRIYNSSWYAIIGSYNYCTTVFYYFIINDTAGNIVDNSAANLSYHVTDDFGPEINQFSHNDNYINYNESVNIHVNVIEPITPTSASGIDSVLLNYSINGVWQTLILMNQLNGTIFNGWWNASIPVQDYNSIIEYYYIVNDTEGNINNNYESRGTYTVEDQFDPLIGGSVYEPSIVNYNDTINISVSISDPTGPALSSGVNTVLLKYSIDGIWQSPINMSLLSGGVWSGWWNATLSQKFNYSTVIQYYFIVNDSASNQNNNYNQISEFTINDTYGPEIISYSLNGTDINYDEWVNITVRIEEPYLPTLGAGIDIVMMNYSIDGGATWKIPIEMSYSSGMVLESRTFIGNYYTIIDPQNYSQMVKFYFIVNDTEGNSNNNLGADLNYTIVDNRTSTIDSYSINDDYVNYNESASIHIRITEPIIPAYSSGVSIVNLSYYTDISGWINVSMNQLNGTIYDGYWNATIPEYPYGTDVQFYFVAIDNAGNVIDDSQSIHQYSIGDEYAPEMSSVQINETDISLSVIVYNETANITIEVIEPADAAGISEANLSYSSDDTSYISVNMIYLSGNGYTNNYYYIVPSQEWNQYHYIKVSVSDNENNIVEYSYSYNVTDLDNPTITNVEYSTDIPEYDEVVVVNATIFDAINASGIDQVILQYKNISQSNWINISMSPIGGNIYQGTIEEYAFGSIVEYQILSFDRVGNLGFDNNSGYNYNYTVIDNTGPVIQAPIIEMPESDQPTDINVTVYEPQNASGVFKVYLYWENSTGNYTIEMTSYYGNDIWNCTVPGHSAGAIIYYYINATDNEKNIRLRPSAAPADKSQYIVGDNTPPDFDKNLVDFPNYVLYGTPFNITINVSDPSGINSIFIGWKVSYIPDLFNTEVHYIDEFIKNGDQYIFTVPGQKYFTPYTVPPHDLYFSIYNITDGSGNTLYPIYEKEIEVVDLISPEVQTPVEASPYQDEDGTHSIEISVNISEPELASGVNYVELRYYNTSIGPADTRYVYSYIKTGDTYTFTIPDQLAMENVTYLIHARDANHMLYGGPNIITTSWYTFPVRLRAEREVADTTYINLKSLTGNNLVNVSIDATRPCLIEIIPYSGVGQPVKSEYSILSGRYQINTNISDTYIQNISIIMFYSQALIDSMDRNESTIVIGIHNGTGYVEQIQNTYVNTIDNYVLLTNLNDLSYFVILGKEAGPSSVINLKAIPFIGTKSINISWDQNTETDLMDYIIYRSDHSSFTPNSTNRIGNTSNNYYLDTDLANGITYYYIVIARDQSYLRSNYLQIVNGTPTNDIFEGEAVQIRQNTFTTLSVESLNMTISFTSQNSFDITIDHIDTFTGTEDLTQLIGYYINITITGSPGLISGKMNIVLDESLIGEIPEENIAIYYWDGDSWEELTSTYFESNHSVTATITHFSVFTIFGYESPTDGGQPFPFLIIIIVVIGALAAVVTVLIIARRGGEKIDPEQKVIEDIKTKGRIKIKNVAEEYKLEVDDVIQIIMNAIHNEKIRGFFAAKKKEFVTMKKLKEDINSLLEGEGEKN